MEDKIQQLFDRFENLKDQLGRLSSNAESEKGTHQREHLRLQTEIDKCEKDLREIIYDREKGLAFIVDRLIRTDSKREKERWFVFVTVGALFFKTILELLTTKK